MREILIRLEDELYEQCKNTKLTGENEGFDFHIIKSVANGTPLEEGLRMNIQWIPTSERQPEHTGDYLVTMGINYDGVGTSDYVRVASYNIYFGWGLYEKNDIHTLFGEITAWAELPKIYNPEKDRE